MKNLKKFAATADYNAFKNGTGMTYPLTSYIENTHETKFDHWVPNGIKMWLDKDVFTEDFKDYAVSDCKSGGDPTNGYEYIFIEEVIYEKKYYWLWKMDMTEQQADMQFENCPEYPYYVFTKPYNNFNDLHKHTKDYSLDNNYMPVCAVLRTDYWGNYKGWAEGDFPIWNFSLIAISGNTNGTPKVKNWNGPLCMAVDGFEGEGFSYDFEATFKNYCSEGYPHEYFETNGQGGNHGEEPSYFINNGETFTYNNQTYRLWSFYGGASFTNLRYCLTPLSLQPSTLYQYSCIYEMYNRYYSFIFLKSDLTPYTNAEMKRYLVDIWPLDIVRWHIGSSKQGWAAETDATYGAGFSASDELMKVGYYKYLSTSTMVTAQSNCFRLYKGGALVITPTDGRKIKKVTITTTSTTYDYNMPVLSPGTGTAIVIRDYTIEWQGKPVSQWVAYTPNGQVRVASLSVEME